MNQYLREELGKGTSTVRLLYELSHTTGQLPDVTDVTDEQQSQESGSDSSKEDDAAFTHHATDAFAQSKGVHKSFVTSQNAIDAFEEIGKSIAMNHLRTSMEPSNTAMRVAKVHWDEDADQDFRDGVPPMRLRDDALPV